MKRKRSRAVKIVRNLVLILLMSLIIYELSGRPILFPRLRMRMMERQELVGPSTVVDVLDGDVYDEFSKVYVGATENGFTFYRIDGLRSDALTYRSKTGDITVIPAPVSWKNWDSKFTDEYLPIYVFDEHPDAVRAQLDIHIASDPDNLFYTGEPFERSYKLESTRETSGFFLFHLHIPCTGETLGLDGYAAQLLSEICHSNNSLIQRDFFTATVRLYRADGSMITETTQTVRTAAAQANGAS